LGAIHRTDDKVFPISAVTGEGLDAMLTEVAAQLKDVSRVQQLHLGWHEGKALAWLKNEDVLEDQTEDETGWNVTVRWSEQKAGQFGKMRDSDA
ncbi:MAG: GTPase HflX, partial [Octadecabacter sp.]|nr:GTPase HflX [Octadecabacter sp.]